MKRDRERELKPTWENGQVGEVEVNFISSLHRAKISARLRDLIRVAAPISPDCSFPFEFILSFQRHKL